MAGSSAPDAGINVDVTSNDLFALASTIPDDALDYDGGDEGRDTNNGREPEPREAPAGRAAEPVGDDVPAEERDAWGRFTRRAEPGTQATATEDEAADAVDSALVDEDATEAARAAADKAAEQPAEPEQAADTQAEPTTIRIKGHDIPVEEVERGFLRQADYTQKTQALAEHVRHVDAYKEQVAGYEGQLSGVLDLAVNIVKGFLPEAPDRGLLNTGRPEDQNLYLRQVDYYNQVHGQLQQLVAQQDGLKGNQTAQEQERQQRASAAVEQRKAQEATKLRSVMPEITTREGQTQFLSDFDKYGPAYGLTLQDIDAIQDHRVYPVLRDAMKFRALQAAKPATVARATTAPPIRAATRAPGTRAGEARQAAMSRLAREGTIDAGVAALPDDLFD